MNFATDESIFLDQLCTVFEARIETGRGKILWIEMVDTIVLMIKMCSIKHALLDFEHRFLGLD
jgi:hypothetical protein